MATFGGVADGTITMLIALTLPAYSPQKGNSWSEKMQKKVADPNGTAEDNLFCSAERK